MGKAKEVAGIASPPSASADKVANEAGQEAMLDHEARGSPVLTLIAKRLRAAKKKVKKVEEIEAIKNSGRDINSDQEEVLKGKAKVQATIEELERLFPLLREQVGVEVSQKLAKKTEEIEASAVAAASAKAAEEAKAIAEAHDVEKGKAAARAEELKVQVEEAAGKAAAEEARRGEQQAAHEASLVELQNAEKASVQQAVTRLLQLNYFSKLFNIEGNNDRDYLNQMERDACLTYLIDQGDALQKDDFDAICAFGDLISSRPQGELISHKTALERCREYAMDWVSAAETRVPAVNATVCELVTKFDRIITSGFYSIKPEMKGAQELAPQNTAPAAPKPYQPHAEANGPKPYQPHLEANSSVLTPSGRDVNANTFSSYGGSASAFGAPQQTVNSNNKALQQLLAGQRPIQQQVTGERQPSLDHLGLATGFMPAIAMGAMGGTTFGTQQPFTSSFKQPGLPSPAPSTGNPCQPPTAYGDAYGDMPHLDSRSLSGSAPQFHADAFQGGSYHPVPKPETVNQTPNRSSAYFHVPTPAPEAAPSAPEPSNTQVPAKPEVATADPVTEQPNDSAPVDRKGSQQQAPRPRPPVDGDRRGRGAQRARGGGGGGRQGDFPPRERGEAVPRGGGRRGGDRRSRGGRGRGEGRGEFAPQQGERIPQISQQQAQAVPY